MLLSELLKLTRQRMFMSQEDFATAIHVSVATINRWENGRSKPNNTAMKNIKSFCKENNLPFEQIEKEWLNYNNTEDTKKNG